jgi:hypothetical protein
MLITTASNSAHFAGIKKKYLNSNLLHLKENLFIYMEIFVGVPESDL